MPSSSFNASFSLEEFAGQGVLCNILPSLVRDGWDDVPTLKLMSSNDMDAQNFSPQQRVALEIRSYLHDRSLMQYADTLEASGKGLSELLATSPTILCSQFGMKRGHVARFIDRATVCGGVTMPPHLSLLPAARHNNRDTSSLSTDDSTRATSSVSFSGSHSADSYETSSNGTGHQQHILPSSLLGVHAQEPPLQKKQSPPTLNSFKGIISAGPAEPRLCGLIRPPHVADDVAPLEVIEKISVQKLTPEYQHGVKSWQQRELKTPPPMKASDIWLRKPTLVYCIRRPGCVMCRAEAHQIYSRKPIFDALGVQLLAVVSERIDSEIQSFWPRFWGGVIVFDENCGFFRALGGGRLPKESFLIGSLLNPVAWKNYRRAKTTGIYNNLHGHGTIKGGVFIIRPGKGGVAYQFVQRNVGDWAPLEEVLDVCEKLKGPRVIEEVL